MNSAIFFNSRYTNIKEHNQTKDPKELKGLFRFSLVYNNENRKPYIPTNIGSGQRLAN
jgi:hypothetical protein